MSEMERLLRVRDELAERAAELPPGELHDAVAFEIGEIDLRLKELWSGEDSGVKQVPLRELDRITEDRRGFVHRA